MNGSNSLRKKVLTMSKDRCVCCGETIPEGRMVCPNCMVTVKENKDGKEKRA